MSIATLPESDCQYAPHINDRQWRATGTRWPCYSHHSCTAEQRGIIPSDQRIHPRTELLEETIYFSEARKGYESDRIHYSGTLVNISKGGAGMKVAHPHLLNEELWLEGLEGFRSAQPGTVKWIKESGEEGFEIGLQFF